MHKHNRGETLERNKGLLDIEKLKEFQGEEDKEIKTRLGTVVIKKWKWEEVMKIVMEAAQKGKEMNFFNNAILFGIKAPPMTMEEIKLLPSDVAAQILSEILNFNQMDKLIQTLSALSKKTEEARPDINLPYMT